MSKVIPGATPSRRLTMNEFVKEKMKKLDETHTNLVIKRLATEEELKGIKDQTTMHEGAVLFLNQMIKEWTVYSNDTLRLRAAEENGHIERIKAENLVKKLKKKLKRKKSRKKR